MHHETESPAHLWVAFLFPVIIIGLRVVFDRLDRMSIRDEVTRHGCTLQSIHWDPFGGWWLGKGVRSYQVVYQSPSGRSITGTCVSSLMFGIKWLNDGPVDHGGKPKDTLPAIATSADSESTCLSCGAVMPARVKRCKACGWSYTE